MSVEEPPIDYDPKDADRYAENPRLPTQRRRRPRHKVAGEQLVRIVQTLGQTQNVNNLRVYYRRGHREQNVAVNLPDRQVVMGMIRREHPNYTPKELRAATTQWLRAHVRKEVLKFHHRMAPSTDEFELEGDV